MKGAAFSRVLLELALVRIATLDQLDDLAELVGRLRQGKGTASGPSAPSVAPHDGTIGTGPAARLSRLKPSARFLHRVEISREVHHDAGGLEAGDGMIQRVGTPVAATATSHDLDLSTQRKCHRSEAAPTLVCRPAFRLRPDEKMRFGASRSCCCRIWRNRTPRTSPLLQFPGQTL